MQTRRGRTLVPLLMALPEIMSFPDLTRKETSDDMAVSPAGGGATAVLTMINPTSHVRYRRLCCRNMAQRNLTTTRTARRRLTRSGSREGQGRGWG
jgi:hypothetical protein